MSKENYKQLIEKESESLNNLLDIEELKEFKMMTSELKDTWEKKRTIIQVKRCHAVNLCLEK